MNRTQLSIAGAAVCAAVLTACGGNDPSTEPTPSTAGSPTDWFRDRLEGSGIDFVHHTGGSGRKYLVEITGSGVSFVDHDVDGDLDVFFCQGAPLPGLDPAAMDPRDRLFRNDGDFRFTDVTDATGAGDTTYSFSAAFPDLDSDGRPDLYLSNFGENRFQRNEGDRFVDETSERGLGLGGWSVCTAWVDLDRDGDLDVYVCNYLQKTMEKEGCDGGLGPEFRTFCNPDEFPGEPDRLLRNDDGRFTDVTDQAGMTGVDGAGLGVVASDLDDDGDVDLFVSNDGRPNFLWRNDGDLRFSEIAFDAGVSVAASGFSEACMGVDSGDLDQDGDFDLFVTNLAGETNAVYRNQGSMFFDDHRVQTGLGPPSQLYVGFGCELFDADHDGDLDVFVTNGHVIDIPQQLDPGTTFRQPPQFFENEGNAAFREVGAAAGAYFRGQYVGRGLVSGDLDGDGDLDVALNHNGDAPALLQNVREPKGHWIVIELRGRPGNRQALGAKVTVEVGGGRWSEEVRGTTSFCAWQDVRQHFGLGAATRVEAVEVRWPTGSTSRFPDLAADRVHVLEEPDA